MAMLFQMVLGNSSGDVIVLFLETKHIFKKFMFNPVYIQNFSSLVFLTVQKL